MTAPKTIHFDLSKKVDNRLKHETGFIIKRAEHKIKNKISQLFSKYKHGNDIFKPGK